LEHFIKLARNGATLVVQNQLPTDVPGLGNLENRRAALKKLLGQLKFTEAGGLRKATLGKGAVLVGPDVDKLLAAAGVQRETMVDNGLEFVRRRHAKGHYYFVTNWGTQSVAAWVPLQSAGAKSVALYNPMTEKLGLASWRTSAQGRPEAYVQLAPGESCLLETSTAALSGPTYAYQNPAGPAVAVAGPWDIRFVSGGPTLPAPVQTKELGSWTSLNGDMGKSFSGTAAYTTTFAQPAGAAEGWTLDLGRVAESARVQLNGQELGTLIGPVYQVYIPQSQLKASNTLVVSVSNGMANRASDMDRRHVPYKNSYNINMASKLKENRGPDGLFTAEKWAPRESGLLGPVTLTPTSTSGPGKVQ
jgi:hypothetical protein